MDDTLEIVTESINASVSASTLRSYRGGWQEFVSYCAKHSKEPLSVDHHFVMRFLGHRSKTVSVSRLYVLLSSISHHYRARGLVSPCDNSMVRMMMKGTSISYVTLMSIKINMYIFQVSKGLKPRTVPSGVPSPSP